MNPLVQHRADPIVDPARDPVTDSSIEPGPTTKAYPGLALAIRRRRHTVLLGLATVSVLAWLGVAISRIDANEVGDLGLFGVVGPAYLLGLAALAVVFAVTLLAPRLRPLVLLAQTGGLLVAVEGLGSFVEANTRFQTAYAHAGFVEYITRTGAVLPTFDARFNWPGTFSLGAFVTEVAGVDSAMAFARWAPILFSALHALAVWVIADSSSRDRRIAWLAVWLFLAANWIGQDYLSPQAVNFFVYLAIIAILVRLFATRRLLASPPLASALVRHPIRSVRDLMTGDAVDEIDELDEIDEIGDDDVAGMDDDTGHRAGPRHRSAERTMHVVLVVLAASIAMSHQLTPVVLVLATAALALTRRTRLWWYPVVVAVLTVAWIVFGATAFWQGHLSELVGGVGSLGQNVSANVADRMHGSTARSLVLAERIGLTLAVIALAGVGIVRHWRHHRWDGTTVLLALVPFSLLGLQSYGGEMLLRSHLFALPFLAIAGARALLPVRRASWRAAAVLAVVGFVLASGTVLARYGNESFERVTDGDLAAVAWVYEHAPAGSTLISTTRNLPWRYRNIESLTYVPHDDSVIADLDSLSAALHRGEPGPRFVVLSASQETFGQQYLGLAPGWTEALHQAVASSAAFEPVYAEPADGLWIYRWRGEP